MSGMLEFYLAYDHSRLFDHTAHMFFRKPQTSEPLAKVRLHLNFHGKRDLKLKEKVA
jgi:hypothetical protein